jgi:hypothetical protein
VKATAVGFHDQVALLPEEVDLNGSIGALANAVDRHQTPVPPFLFPNMYG